jgi:hypothetical protein
VASDEVRRWGWNMRKRRRLIEAGAAVLVPDFREAVPGQNSAYVFAGENRQFTQQQPQLAKANCSTMIYTHVLRDMSNAPQSLLDAQYENLK